MSFHDSARSEGIIGISFLFLKMKVCCVFALELPHQGDSNEYTHYTFFPKDMAEAVKLFSFIKKIGIYNKI